MKNTTISPKVPKVYFIKRCPDGLFRAYAKIGCRKKVIARYELVSGKGEEYYYRLHNPSTQTKGYHSFQEVIELLVDYEKSIQKLSGKISTGESLFGFQN